MATRKHGKNKHLLTSPGTLTYVGPAADRKPAITQISYNSEQCQKKELAPENELYVPNDEQLTTWYHINGIHEASVVERVGLHFGIHTLVLEDLLNTTQKPKLEWLSDDSVLVIMKALSYRTPPKQKKRNKTARREPRIEASHVGFVVRRQLLLSFQEMTGEDAFSEVERRLTTSVGKTRTNGTDYLLFSLIDVLVDNYFLVLENLEERLDEVEDEIIQGGANYKLGDLYALKQDLTVMRRSILPMREILLELMKNESGFIAPHVLPYFRDLYDHVAQAVESIEVYRDLLASLVDVHLSSMSYRMNQVMKTLTVFSAIFMPLTFIVGVYGMNFEHMPELHWPNGYYLVWGMMIVIALALYSYFRWKKWT